MPLPKHADGIIHGEDWDTLVDSVEWQPYSYIIYTEGGTYYAKNGSTGVIDYSGADASTVIQAAHDGLPNGGKIFITASVVGSYSGTLVIENSNIQLLGATGNQLTHTGTGSAILVNGTVGAYIENVMIDGLHIIGSGGAEEDLIAAQYGNNVVVKNCILENSREEGVVYYDCTYSKILNNYFDNCGTDATNPSVEVKDNGGGNPCYGNRVEGNIILNSPHMGIQVTSSKIDVLNNIVYNPLQGVADEGTHCAGIWVSPVEINPIEDVRVSGNTV